MYVRSLYTLRTYAVKTCRYTEGITVVVTYHNLTASMHGACSAKVYR